MSEQRHHLVKKETHVHCGVSRLLGGRSSSEHKPFSFDSSATHIGTERLSLSRRRGAEELSEDPKRSERPLKSTVVVRAGNHRPCR